MDGAKKTLLATVFTAAIMVASAAAYAGVISVPEFNLSIPTPDQSAPSQPGQNMPIPTIPSGKQIPTTTQLPPSVAALPSIAMSGQSGVPIYGNPVPSTDSTGASGATQNLAYSCYASGGSWNPSTSTCSTNSTSSLSDQCTQMGGQYDRTKNQCQLVSLPGSGGAGGWIAGEWMWGPGGTFMRVKSYGASTLLQIGHVISYPAGTCQMVNINSYNADSSGNSGGYCTAGGSPSYTYDCSSSGNWCNSTATCPYVGKPMWSGTTTSCSASQVGQSRPAYSGLTIDVAQWDVTNITSVAWNAGVISPIGFLQTSSHTEYVSPWNISGNPFPN